MSWEASALPPGEKPGVALYVIYAPLFIAFGAAGLAVGLWFGLLFVVPGLLYRYPGLASGRSIPSARSCTESSSADRRTKKKAMTMKVV